MTPVDPGRRRYVHAVLDAYLGLVDTPDKARPADRLLASRLHDDDIPLTTVLDAILLASARRLIRPDDRPPLPPVRSLHYFLPVIEELQQTPLPAGYAQYLQAKVAAKSTISNPPDRMQVGEMSRKQRF